VSLSFQNVATDAQIKHYMKPKIWREIVDYLIYFLVVLLSVSIIYMGVRYFLIDTIAITGKSMYPNYNNYTDSTQHDVIQIDLLTPRFGDYRRGEVVVLMAPEKCDPNRSLFIKRVIGLPGDKIILENGKVWINGPETDGQTVHLDESNYLSKDILTYKSDLNKGMRFEENVLGKDEYYVMGDNRGYSKDSRYCGKIDKKIILGREVFRLLPIEKKKFFEIPKYNIGN
jgi:signal peptidase I